MKKTGMLVRSALLAAVFIIMSAQAVLADDTTRFVPGTRVNGIGIGGLTVDEAKTQIEGFYSAEYKLTIKERDGKTETLKGSDVGYKAAAPEGKEAGKGSPSEVPYDAMYSQTRFFSVSDSDRNMFALPSYK